MKPEAQYSGFIERFQSYSKEYSTLKDATYAALKDAILLNMFPSEITETEISALLHISRTPIREAMLQLSNDGLLEINHGRKAKIRSLTEKDITDLAIVLDSIHHLALMLCIDHASKDFHHLHKYNSRFHSQIARASGNIWLLDIMDRLLSYTSVFREYAISRPNRMDVACEEHAAIFQAICNRDKEEGTRLISLHVQNAFSLHPITSQSEPPHSEEEHE